MRFLHLSVVLLFSSFIVNFLFLELIVFVCNEGEDEENEEETKSEACLINCNLSRTIDGEAHVEPDVGENREDTCC